MVETPDVSRRGMLKKVGVGVLSTPLAGIANGESKSHDDVTEGEFDPSSRESTVVFLSKVLEESSSESGRNPEKIRSVLNERLSAEQKQALSDVLENYVDLDVNTSVQKLQPSSVTNTQATGAISTQSTQFGSFSYTITTEININVCGSIQCVNGTYVAYDFTHELQWYYDEDGVISGTADCSGEGHDYGLVHWDYEGRTGYNKETHPDGHYVKTYREGQFEQNIVIDEAFSRIQHPSCWVQGDDNGSGSAYDIETE